MSKRIESSQIAFDVLTDSSKMSRRDALKVMGLTGGAAMMMGAPTPVEAERS